MLDIRHAELRRNQGDIRGSAEQRVIRSEDIGERGRLLARGPCAVTGTRLLLLRSQAVRDDRVAVVQAVHVGVEQAEASAHDRLRPGLPGESEARGEPAKLIGILTGERESGIFRRLRVDLEVLAQAHFQSQFRQRLKSVLHVEAVVRHGKRKSRVSRCLTEIEILSERKRFQIGKFIEAERRAEVDRLVRIRAAIIGVGIPGAVEIETKLQGVLADHVIDAIEKRVLSFENSSDRERSVAQNESGGAIQNHRRRVRSQAGRGGDFVIRRRAGVKFVEQAGGESVRPSQGGLEGMDIRVGQGLRSVIADRRVKDDASGGIESVEIEGEKQAVAVVGLIIQPGRDHPIVALSGFDSEIGAQRIEGIRHLL